jgi:hypothetical protein
MKQVPVSLFMPSAVPNCRFRHGREQHLCILIESSLGSSLLVTSFSPFVIILGPIKEFFFQLARIPANIQCIPANLSKPHICRCDVTLFVDLEAKTEQGSTETASVV